MPPDILMERRTVSLTNEQVEQIAELAAEKAIVKMREHIYQEVGKNFLEKMLWIVGLIAIGTAAYMQRIGLIK